MTEAEQQRLRTARVAIAGLGGVGGIYLLTLARLGVGRFCLADFDTYALANFNRQVGAGVSSIGRPKLDVMVEMALEINPELDIRRFPAGIQPADFDAFLDGVDVYLDGLDFFALDVRAALFARCAAAGIPATTVAPLGMGAALLNFVPGRMTFEEYFGFEGRTENERALRFLTGLSPSMLQLPYLVDPSRVDLAARRGPSTVVGVTLCAAVAAGQIVKLVLGRGDVVAAPSGLHFDIYRNRLKTTWRPGGHRHPVQRLMRRIARARLPGDLGTPGAMVDAAHDGTLPGAVDRDAAFEQIRAAGVLAPSADNRPAAAIVRRSDGIQLAIQPPAATEQPHQAWLRQLATGAMAENMLLRAAQIGHPLALTIDAGAAPDGPAVRLTWAEAGANDATTARDRPLAEAIPNRHTNRRFFRREPAAGETLARIAGAARDIEGADLLWFDRPGQRRIALDVLRLAEAERFRRDELHRELFAAIRFDVGWRSSASEGLPPGALEVEPPMRALFAALRRPAVMRAARRLGAPLLLGIRAAYLPARSAPHLAGVVVRGGPDASSAVRAGQALERAWLAATACGLEVQPFAAAGALMRMEPGNGWVEAVTQRLIAERVAGLLDGRPARDLHIVIRLGHAAPPSITTLRR